MCEFRVAMIDAADIETHVRLREDFIREMMLVGGGDAWNDFIASTRRWMESHLNGDSYIGYLAYADNIPVSAAGMLLYELPPLPTACDRQVGHILNFFTYPEHRRRGYAVRLLEHIKKDAKHRGIERLFLNAAPMGERLYRGAGFSEQAETALILKLR